jgi:hypothetical protein
MANRKENIDIVFRNGLKDFETVPPIDIWENIKPAIKKRPIPSYTWKVAASFAILLSLGVFSYRLGMNSAIRLLETERGSVASTVSETTISSPTFAVVNERTSPIESTTTNLIVNNTSKYDNTTLPVEFREREAVETSRIIISSPVVDFDNSPENKLLLDNRRTYSIEEMNGMLLGMEMNNTTGDEEKARRWSIAALASPTYLPGAEGKNNQPMLAMNERRDGSYTGGVTFAYEINDRISVQSGLYYSSVGQQISGISAYSGFDPYNMSKSSSTFQVATQSGTIASSNPDIFLSDMAGDRISGDYSADNFDPVKSDLPMIGTSLHQNFRYLELPLTVRYKLLEGNLDFNIIGGLSSNILVGNSVFLNSSGVKYEVGSTDGLRDHIVSSTLGMGLEYSISKSISLNVEPIVRYYITPVNNSSGGISPFTLGLFSGISYKF